MSNVYGESKLAYHSSKLEDLSKGIVSAPVYIRIKPENRCNHNCTFCGYDQDNRRSIMDRTSQIPLEKMMEIISDLKDMGVKAVTYSGGGEPLIYPFILQAMLKTLESRIKLSIITNGQELAGQIVDVLKDASWVRVSVSESDPVIFVGTRRRSEEWFYARERNIRSFARAKSKKCELGINLVVQERNWNNIYGCVRYFRDLGANHIKITPSWTPDFVDYHKPTLATVLDQIKRAREKFETADFKVHDTYQKDFEHCGVFKRNYQRCLIQQCVTIIGADCNVYFCHDKAYSREGVLGSIKHRSFKELWFSEETAQRFKDFNAQVECNHHCANDKKNIMALHMIENPSAIDTYKPSSDKHGEFI
jgi:MoaA/NifB/PqqE/SkfB family radical SAM enzyme